MEALEEFVVWWVLIGSVVTPFCPINGKSIWQRGLRQARSVATKGLSKIRAKLDRGGAPVAYILRGRK